MLKLRLHFNESDTIFAYKRYAYIKTRLHVDFNLTLICMKYFRNVTA